MSELPLVKSTVNKLSKQSPYIQIAVSGVGGFVTGFVLLRISKILAIFVGGAVLTVELAVQAGIITIDWDKLLAQQEAAQNQAAGANARAVERSPFSASERVDPEMVDKVKHLILSSARLSVAFLGGFLLGFGFA